LWLNRVGKLGNFILLYFPRIYIFLDRIFSQTEEEIKNETDKRARWAKDNIRRRHNFLPLVMEIIKQMASQKSLVPAVTKVSFEKCHIYNIFGNYFRLKKGQKLQLNESDSGRKHKNKPKMIIPDHF